MTVYNFNKTSPKCTTSCSQRNFMRPTHAHLHYPKLLFVFPPVERLVVKAKQKNLLESPPVIKS